MSMHTSGQFRGLRNATSATDMRGAIDFTQADSFNLYEKGHSILKVLSVPNFMTAWANFKGYTTDSFGRLIINNYKTKTTDIKTGIESNDDATESVKQKRKLCNNFYKILETEFKGLDGLDDMSADSMSISDGFSTLNVLGKVNYATNQEITLKYTEKAGSTISRYAESYLRGIRDPRTGVKHYNGCLTTMTLDPVDLRGKKVASNAYYADGFQATNTKLTPRVKYNGLINPSLENEVFTFLYIVLDNTWTQIEKAYLLCNAQLNKIPLGQVANMEKGNIELAEIDLSFNCFVVSNANVNAAAAKYLPKILNNYNLISNEFVYEGQKKAVKQMNLTKKVNNQDVPITDGKVTSIGDVTTSLSK